MIYCVYKQISSDHGIIGILIPWSDHIWLKKSMKEMNYIFYRGPIWTFWTSQKNTYYMHEFDFFFLQNIQLN